MPSITLPARPAPVELDFARTAVIVVDMQNDFGSKGGMFHRAGIDIETITQIVPRIAAVLAAARGAGVPVVYLKQQHAPDLADAGSVRAPHFIKHQRMQLGRSVTAPDGSPSRILVADTWNTAIIEALTPEPEDVIVGKHRYSGFFETDLHERLLALGVDTLVFVGATTSICVESTLRDAMFRDYICVALADCTAEPIAHDATRSNHDASLLNIELLLGWVANSGDLRAALGGFRQAAE
ncbi:MAG: cysteine hydrolase [Devosia sp.]|nr:cysteine hydrolase [Devosia sp.]